VVTNETRFKKGGFPEIWTKELGEDYLRTLFDAIIYKDVVKRWNVKYPNKIEDLGRYLLAISPAKYTISKLKRILEFRSKTTLEKYIKYLEEAYLIFSLERFSYKEKEKINAPRKVYSVDTGMMDALSSKLSLESGRLIENCVFIQLRRKYKENKNLFYYQTNGYEVDFVIKEGLKVKQLIQVCYDINDYNTKQRELRALIKASKELKCRNLLVITWDYESMENFKWRGLERKIKFVPLWKWLLFM